MSFLELILNYNELQNKGYNKLLLDQNLNSMMSIPFFLFIMTALASILTMNTLKKSNNFTYILTGLVTCVIIYYFKDLSLALGQTNRISLSLASWIPVVAIGLFSSIGILQINENKFFISLIFLLLTKKFVSRKFEYSIERNIN